MIHSLRPITCQLSTSRLSYPIAMIPWKCLTQCLQPHQHLPLQLSFFKFLCWCFCFKKIICCCLGSFSGKDLVCWFWSTISQFKLTAFGLWSIVSRFKLTVFIFGLPFNSLSCPFLDFVNCLMFRANHFYFWSTVWRPKLYIFGLWSTI